MQWQKDQVAHLCEMYEKGYKACDADQLRVIKIAKNRDGSRRTLPFWFEGRYQRFVEQWDGFDEAQVVQMEDEPYKQTKIETA